MTAALICLALTASTAWAQDDPEPESPSEDRPRLSLQVELPMAEQLEHLVEFSFGSTLLYVEQPLLDGYLAVQGSRVLPVPSVLMLAEWLIRPRWILGGLLNLPTAPIRVLEEDGESYSEEASTAVVALGGSYVPFQVRFGKNALFQPQLGLMVGRSINNSIKDTFFPMAVGRVHLHTKDGFSMYFGTAFAGRRDTFALLYGVGHRF
jgi:hypothetical protein